MIFFVLNILNVPYFTSGNEFCAVSSTVSSIGDLAVGSGGFRHSTFKEILKKQSLQNSCREELYGIDRFKMNILWSVLFQIYSCLLFYSKLCSSTASSNGIIDLSQFRNLAFVSNSTFKLDISFSIPIPMLGDAEVSIDLDATIEVNFLNQSIVFKPVEVPYLIWPEAKPIEIDLTGNQGHKYNNYDHDPYYGNEDNSYAPYFQPRNLIDKRIGPIRQMKSSKPIRKRKDSVKGIKNIVQQLNKYLRRHKRNVATVSAQHRSDLFTFFEDILAQYGVEGEACICRAVCELVEVDFLIESPLHEIIEHLLR